MELADIGMTPLEVMRAATYDAKTRELRFAAKHPYGIGNPWNKQSKRQFYALHVFEDSRSAQAIRRHYKNFRR